VPSLISRRFPRNTVTEAFGSVSAPPLFAIIFGVNPEMQPVLFEIPPGTRFHFLLTFSPSSFAAIREK